MLEAWAAQGLLLHGSEGLTLFETMRSRVHPKMIPDTITYNTMIAGWCVRRKQEQALSLFREMRTAGVKPNEETFTTLVRGWIELKDMKQRKQLNLTY
jgi:pentatricopeptide repeat protein